MKHVVFCEIAWMKNYAGVTDEDKPMRGGRYIKENGTGGEIWNFSPYNHYCYGYVMHYGNELHLERLDGVSRNDATVDDVTVVWVATDGSSSKVVGFYENSTMHRYWQTKFDVSLDIQSFDYNFIAKVKDCYLIPEEKRSFVVPRAPKEGRGKGMGQSQIWYCESAFAQNTLIPKVLDYCENIKKECCEIELDPETLNAPAEDTGLSVNALIDAAYDDLKKGLPELALQKANRALLTEDSVDVRSCRADCYMAIQYYDEAHKDLEIALKMDPESFSVLHSLLWTSLMREDYDRAIEIGEAIHDRRKEEASDWSNAASNLFAAYMMKHSAKAKQLLQECQKEDDQYHFTFLPNALADYPEMA